MFDTISRYIEGLPSEFERRYLGTVLKALGNTESTLMLSSAGLVIGTVSAATAKTGASDAYALIKGYLVKIAAGTAMAALSGTVANAAFNVFCFFVDSAGTLTSAMGTAGATLGAVKFPSFPAGKALVGFVIVNPTGAGNFVGGTTALNDVTVVPNAVYVSPTGGIDPSILP